MYNKTASDRRRFFRVNKKEPCRYEAFSLSDRKIHTSKLVKAVSSNLSTAGIAFTTKHPPEMSSILLIHLDQHMNQHLIEIKKRSFLYKDRILGKVVRVEEVHGEYEVGVAFVTKQEKIAKELAELLAEINKTRVGIVLQTIAALLAAAFIALVANIVYLQFKETYQPERMVLLAPSSIGIKYEEVYFKALDGQMINGWFIAAENAKATVIFCHGRSGNISGELNRVNFFHNMGLNVFIFDYRGYGKSSGEPYEEGLFNDAKGAYDYVIKRKNINKNEIIVVGESLGGAVAADLAANRNVKAVILESTFVSLREQAKTLYPSLPIQRLLVEKYNTLEKIKKIHVPKLIIHGVNDELVPFKAAQELFDGATEPKRFIAFKGGHSDGVFKVSDQYKQDLNQFFEDYKIFQ